MENVFTCLEDNVYVQMIQLLQQRCVIRAVRFQTDFERPTINAINRLFPSARLKCCSFNLTQCVSREVNIHRRKELWGALFSSLRITCISSLEKLNEIGLTTCYNAEFELNVESIKRRCSLALVKPTDINPAMEYT